MNKEAVQRLREPAAWVLLASAGVQLLAGIILLLGGSGAFTYRALGFTEDTLFTQIVCVGLLVLAVLLTTWGDTPTPQARTIAMGALGVFGGTALFAVVAWLSGMAADGTTAVTKLSVFLAGAGKLAVIGVGAWFVFTVFQSMQPARPQPQMQQGYPDYGYQQGQQPGQQQYAQQGYGQQYQQYQQYQQGAEGQQAAQQAYGQQPYQQYAQQQDYQQYQQQYGQPGQAQPGQAQPGQGEQPQAGQQGQQGQAGQQGQQPAADPQQEEMGEWTRAYGGSGGAGQEGQGAQPGPQGTQPGQPQGEQRPEDSGDWYRDNRPPPPQ